MTTPTLQKFQAVATALKSQFIERDAIIESLLAALASGQHVLLLGLPGTAKSALANALAASITGATKFAWLLTKASPPEEILGPISLAGLEKDEFRRVTVGKLPEAHIAFLDEIFKCNSTVLNAMLSILNERTFYNGGAAITVPLLTAVGASNEYPTDPELGALYDRFLVRWWVEPISDGDLFVKMLQVPEPKGLPGAIDFADIEQARSEVRQIKILPNILATLRDIKLAGEAKGIVVSDRRWRQALRYLRAIAWYDGKTEVEEDHFMALADCLWREHKERSAVAQFIGKVSNPVLIQAIELFDACKEQVKDAEKKDGEEGFAWSVRVGKLYQEMAKVLKRLEELANANPGKTKVQTIHADVSRMATDLKTRALKSAGMA